MSWTDERVELLRKLWTEGLSASQIAGELGGVTRNAVIGKVHRLGLSGRAKAQGSLGSAVRQKRPAARPASFPKPAKNGSRSGAVALQASPSQGRSAAIADIPKPDLLMLDLLKLSETTCKWPSGDPQEDSFGFCGNPSREGAPYCEYHCRIAYQPAAERRRDRTQG